jgi:hypothetical protein
MKRAKTILTGISLLAICSAVTSLNGTRVTQIQYTINAAGQCRVTTFNPITTQAQAPNQPIFTITDRYSTSPTSLSCPLTTWYTIE